MSSLTDRLTAIARSPATVTVTTAAIAAFVAAALTAGGVRPLLARLQIVHPGNAARVVSREERLLRHVFQRAAEGNPSSVLAVMDDFGWKTEFHMSVGDHKGVFLRNQVANRKPKVAVEIGQSAADSRPALFALSRSHVITRLTPFVLCSDVCRCWCVGGYCGYSATLIASQLPADGHLYSIEVSRPTVTRAKD